VVRKNTRTGQKSYLYLELRSLFFWDVTQRRLVVYYRPFVTTYRFRFQGPISWPETSVTNYQSTLRNISEEQRYYSYFGGILKSRSVRPTSMTTVANGDKNNNSSTMRCVKVKVKSASGPRHGFIKTFGRIWRSMQSLSLKLHMAGRGGGRGKQ